MIEIDYHGGLHGHFFSYVLNSLDHAARVYDPVNPGGSYNDAYESQIAIAKHFAYFNYPFASSDVISITAEPSDSLLAYMLSITRGSDANIDLNCLEENFYSKLKGLPLEEHFIKPFRDGYGIDITEQDSVPRGVLREVFKIQLHDEHECSIIKDSLAQEVYYKRFNISRIYRFNFKELYNFDSFINVISDCISTFNLPYDIDVKWYRGIWETFIQRIYQIKCVEDAKNILDIIVRNGPNTTINFNVLQEAWLNARLENVYGKEMPFEQEKYFKDTQSIIEYIEHSG